METVVITLICIALLVFGGLTLSDISLSSTDTIATAWREMEDGFGDIARTQITSLGGETQSSGTIIEVTLDNTGETKLRDFSKWDVIMQHYYSGVSTQRFADSFENGLGNWVQDAQNDWFQRDNRAVDGTWSAEADDLAVDATLTLATPLDFSAGSDWTPDSLTFSWYIEGIFESDDYLALDIWNGSGWDLAVRQLVGIDGGTFSPEESWQNETVDISSYTISDFQIRFRASTDHNSEEGNVDLVSVTGVPTGCHIERMAYTALASPGDNEWTVEGIYMDAATSDAEVFDPNMFNPDEQMVLRMQVDPATEVGSEVNVIVSTPNGVTASTTFTAS